MPCAPQGGLGEASCLALTSYYSGRPSITMWSSGTGFAGVFGYAWVALLHVLGEWRCCTCWVGGLWHAIVWCCTAVCLRLCASTRAFERGCITARSFKGACSPASDRARSHD